MQIQLGCLNRPWYNFTLEESLAGIVEAGFRYCGFISSQQERPLIAPETAVADLARIAAAVEQYGLTAQVLVSNTDTELPHAQAVAKLKRTVDWCQRLGLPYLILTGTHNESKYEAWYEGTAAALDYAQERGVFVMLKAHGGNAALARDLLRAVARFDHPDFGLCYDPGNIYYYTGEKAEEDLPKVAAQVNAMCIKDETGGRHGEVSLTPGTGLVDFPRIFSILDEHGFAGPCWVECVGGATLDEINAEAKKTYRFITDVVAAQGAREKT